MVKMKFSLAIVVKGKEIVLFYGPFVYFKREIFTRIIVITYSENAEIRARLNFMYFNNATKSFSLNVECNNAIICISPA